MKVVAIVGLSGVGKTTLLRSLADQMPFLHLQASQIVKDEQLRRNGASSTSEELRAGPVIDNQELLIRGFEWATKDGADLVVFDGHAIVDAGDSIIEIPSSVFRRIGCHALVVLTEDATELVRRRTADTKRSRPVRTAAEIERQQQMMIEVAGKISCDLGIPCIVHRAISSDALEAALRNV